MHVNFTYSTGPWKVHYGDGVIGEEDYHILTAQIAFTNEENVLIDKLGFNETPLASHVCVNPFPTKDEQILKINYDFNEVFYVSHFQHGAPQAIYRKTLYEAQETAAHIKQQLQKLKSKLFLGTASDSQSFEI